ncbi:MAG TPA: FAD-dependent oxidoreductase [Ktedonobacteraceae bacterium]|nr:FAD-dependent oxidoreductase [Ktedonobacteraceae bacterium]
MDILVIGSGVSGLTSALCLLQAGHRVSIWAKDQPPHTTSNIASAIWFPFKAYPLERVTVWGEVTLRTFEKLRLEKGTGIIMTNFLEVKQIPHPEEPTWAKAVKSFRLARADELPAGYPGGYTFEAPVIDTGLYLAYLMRQFQEQGGQILPRVVTNLAEAFAQSNVVVNCSGLGARELVGDQDLHPARGQALRIKQNGFRRVLLDEEGPNQLAYIVPRTHDIVLGGTFQENNWNTEENPLETPDILRRCANLAPEFATLTANDIEQVVCGLRPVRSTVRVEAERLSPDRLLVHNYGHGGAGITLSWGCATEVVELVSQVAGGD